MEKKALELKSKKSFKINKRYKDLFEIYIHRGEPTPFTIGTIVVFAFCFLIFIVSTFLQFDFSNIWLKNLSDAKEVLYTPQIPAMLFIIYILGRNYSILLFAAYLIVGFFVWPIFAFGGGLGYIQSYLFGYLLGFLVAIFAVCFILKKSMKIQYRLLAALVGVLSVHITGFIYCLLLAIFKVIDFSLIAPIAKTLSGERILYDNIFGLLILLIAPYIKNIFWICMKPKSDEKKSKKFRRKTQSN